MSKIFNKIREYNNKTSDGFSNYLIGGDDVISAYKYSPSDDGWDSLSASTEEWNIVASSNGTFYNYDGTSIVGLASEADDDFDDEDIDPRKWGYITGSVDESGGTLNLLYDPTGTVDTLISSLWTFTGDFNFSVDLFSADFYLGSGTNAYGSASVLLENAFGGTTIYPMSLRVSLIYDLSGYYWSIGGSYRDVQYPSYTTGYDSTFNGATIRVTRTANRFRFYRDGWEIGNGIEAEEFSKYPRVAFSATSEKVDTTTSCSFDDFQINSGEISNKASWALEDPAFGRGVDSAYPDNSIVVLSRDLNNYYVDIIDEDNERLWMRFVGNSNSALSQGGFGNSFVPIKVVANYGTVLVPFNAVDTTDFGGVLSLGLAQDEVYAKTYMHFERNEYLGNISQRNDERGWSFQSDQSNEGLGFFYDQRPSVIRDFDSLVLSYLGSGYRVFMLCHNRGATLYTSNMGSYWCYPLELRDMTTAYIRGALVYDSTSTCLTELFTHTLSMGFLHDKFEDTYQSWDILSRIDSVSPSSIPALSGDTSFVLDGTFASCVIGYFDDKMVDSTRVDGNTIALTVSASDLSNTGTYDVYVKHIYPDLRQSNIKYVDII